jgi:deoxyribodipyrimidine photo-lyase
MEKEKIVVFWFRRDLRIEDNHGLYQASKLGLPILPIFIFDPNILDKLPSKKDGRVQFIHQQLIKLNQFFQKKGSAMQVFHQKPLEAFDSLFSTYQIQAVFCNHDYEKYAIQRDASIAQLCEKNNAKLHSFKDQVIFEKDEVLSGQNTPYTVFTPYSRRWKAVLQEKPIVHYPSEEASNFVKHSIEIPSLSDIGFQSTDLHFPAEEVTDVIMQHYGAKRDFPSLNATSRLSVHLRFGTISVRKLVQRASKISEVYLNELIWRDFYFNILHHFPHISDGHSFRKQYDQMTWKNDERDFEAWKNGQTGYPIVDAGMRELNATGFMHNRVRMIVASFLVKHLLIDWRWGEAYFAEKLLDFDFSANNGGWQWASGSGCDAAPYFRVFNPTLQTQKFDPKFEYIKKWVPEFQEFGYPAPIVNHEFARKRVLDAYAKALGKD